VSVLDVDGLTVGYPGPGLPGERVHAVVGRTRDGRHLLAADERTTIDALMAEVQARLGSEDAAAIEAASEALAKGTEGFAALRMNRGIQQALAGKKLEEV